MTAHLPRRGDEVEAWLRAQRDGFPRGSHSWGAADCLLDTYRLHADTSTPLDQHCCEGGTPDDCHGCYEATQQPQPAPTGSETGCEYGLRCANGYVFGPYPTPHAAAAYAITGRTLVRRTVTHTPWTEAEEESSR